MLHTDNGGEYTFKESLKTERVLHERAIPKAPEHAERLDRTLLETVCSMLIDSKLPHKLWAEVLSTAAYLRNLSPTKALEGTTPYEAWTNKKPSVNHFSCEAFAHIPKDEREKLDSKARKYVFLGYG